MQAPPLVAHHHHHCAHAPVSTTRCTLQREWNGCVWLRPLQQARIEAVLVGMAQERRGNAFASYLVPSGLLGSSTTSSPARPATAVRTLPGLLAAMPADSLATCLLCRLGPADLAALSCASSTTRRLVLAGVRDVRLRFCSDPHATDQQAEAPWWVRQLQGAFAPLGTAAPPRGVRNGPAAGAEAMRDQGGAQRAWSEGELGEKAPPEQRPRGLSAQAAGRRVPELAASPETSTATKTRGDPVTQGGVLEYRTGLPPSATDRQALARMRRWGAHIHATALHGHACMSCAACTCTGPPPCVLPTGMHAPSSSAHAIHMRRAACAWRVAAARHAPVQGAWHLQWRRSGAPRDQP